MTIEQANTIIRSYQAEGLCLTLRQLYYQFVSKDLIANTVKEYNRLGDIISNGRMTGHINWDAIEDRGRNVVGLHWGNSSPQQKLNLVAKYYERKYWVDQPVHVEVWIEKDALVGVIESICERLHATGAPWAYVVWMSYFYMVE